MANFNRVMLMGNLTRTPEIRYTPSGTAVVDLRLAINETYKTQSGENVERTCFVDVVVWGRMAENAATHLYKGSPVFVEGRLQLDQWESPQGEKQSKLCVRARWVEFLGSPNRGPESEPTSSAPSREVPEQDEADDGDVPF